MKHFTIGDFVHETSEFDNFSREKNMLIHIEKKRLECVHGNDHIIRMKSFDDKIHTITTFWAGKLFINLNNSEAMHIRNIPFHIFEKQLQDVESFLKCANIIHCDALLRNWVIQNEKLTLIDMDLSYIVGDKVPKMCTTPNINISLKLWKQCYYQGKKSKYDKCPFKKPLKPSLIANGTKLSLPS